MVSAAQVRRDLMVIGYSGSPNKGYDVAACIESIGSFLDGPVQQEVALVGVGNLGHAVLSHFADKSPSVAIVAAFDVDPALTDTHGPRGALRRRLAHGGAGARPRHRRSPCSRCPGAGRPGVGRRRSCARASRASSASRPRPSRLPNDIFVEYMDITAALESAAYFARLGGRDEPPTNGDGDIEPMVKKLESLLARSNMKLEDLAASIGAHVVTPGKPGRHRRSPRSTPATA